MVRYYCDICGNQISRNYISDRLKATFGERRGDVTKVLNFEVIAGIGYGNANGGHVCCKCLVNAVISAGNNDPHYNDPMAT